MYHTDHRVGPHVRNCGKGKGYKTTTQLNQYQTRSSHRAASYGCEQLDTKTFILFTGKLRPEMGRRKGKRKWEEEEEEEEEGEGKGWMALKGGKGKERGIREWEWDRNGIWILNPFFSSPLKVDSRVNSTQQDIGRLVHMMIWCKNTLVYCSILRQCV